MADFQVEDLEYQRPDDKPLLARLYRPSGSGPFPAVLEVHGGAWTGGDRLNNVDIAKALAAAGVLVASIDFRMPPAATYPTAVADVNFGVRWLKANAVRLGSRPDLVGGLGTSSGGHLLLLSTLKPHDPRYAALQLPIGHDARLPWIVACWPVADPLARYHAVKARGNDRLVNAHHQFWPSEDAMAEGNPQRILERGEAVELPPALVLQGTNDDNLTPDMADNFVAAYRQRGGTATLEKFEGQPHTFVSRDPTSAASLRALDLIKAFVHKQAGAR
ncbi:MAG: alpha/beta hydrolase [Proteobacteria bacterium]|nr:alpha/beta hydrolase [Pseudomonadota bacterium]